jgi:hypothetical protein
VRWQGRLPQLLLLLLELLEQVQLRGQQPLLLVQVWMLLLLLLLLVDEAYYILPYAFECNHSMASERKARVCLCAGTT